MPNWDPETTQRVANIMTWLREQDPLVLLGAGGDEVQQSLQDELAHYLEPDFIPKDIRQGGGIEDMINVRPAPPLRRCLRITGDDLQSGPFYCGAPATVVADSKEQPGRTYVWCNAHVPHEINRQLQPAKGTT
jgi:hypothetical protein